VYYLHCFFLLCAFINYYIVIVYVLFVFFYLEEGHKVPRFLWVWQISPIPLCGLLSEPLFWFDWFFAKLFQQEILAGPILFFVVEPTPIYMKSLLIESESYENESLSSKKTDARANAQRLSR